MSKLIMVDLDGTLFDTKEVNYLAYKEAMSPYGYSIDYRYYCEFCNGRHYMDFMPQIATDNEEILCAMHKVKKKIYRKYLAHARMNETLVDILRICRREYKVALVTTASKKNTYDILEHYGLVDDFDLILTHEDVSNVKPDPEGYIKAMEYFGANPTECIIFEDSAIGIEAADASGAQVYVVKGYN